MEKSTTLGMTLGLFAVGYGMYLKGADPHALINPAAFLIIFAGTFAALLNAFPMKDIKRFGKLLKIIFTGKKITSKQEILELFVSLAKSAKSEGVMGIEKKANEVEDPFIRSTLILVADGFRAVIGLIAALGNLSDIDMLGHSIAAAFVATLLGIFTGYVMWHPFANKLKRISAEEVEMKKMVLEGALALQSGASSIAMEAKLQSFIPLSQRKSLRDEG